MAEKISKQFKISYEQALKALQLKKEIDNIGGALDSVKK